MKTHQQALSMGDCNAVDNPYILSLQECPFPTMTNGSLLKHVSTEGATCGFIKNGWGSKCGES